MNIFKKRKLTFISKLGRFGERKTARYIKRQGGTVIAKGYTRHKLGEIDVIAIKQDLILFVEVKTRINTLYQPAAAVTYDKQQKIIRTAKAFLKGNPQFNCLYPRFDVCEVYAQKNWCGFKTVKLNYIEGAFTT